MGGGISGGLSSDVHDTSKMSYLSLRLEMEKTIVELEKPMKHKNYDNIIVLPGKRYIFNPLPPQESDIEGLMSLEEFSCFVKQINEAGIRSLVGLPYNMQFAKRFAITEKAVLAEIFQSNKALSDRNISWELRPISGSTSHIDKNFNTYLQLRLPKNNLCAVLTDLGTRVTERETLDMDDMDLHTNMNTSNLNSSNNNNGRTSLTSAIRNRLRGGSAGGSSSTPSSSSSTTNRTSNMKSSSSNIQKKHRQDEKHIPREDEELIHVDFDDSAIHGGPVGGHAGAHHGNVMDPKVEHNQREHHRPEDEFDHFASSTSTSNQKSAIARETDTAKFHSNVSTLMHIVPPHVSRQKVERELRNAGGDLNRAAQVLLSGNDTSISSNNNNTKNERDSHKKSSGGLLGTIGSHFDDEDDNRLRASLQVDGVVSTDEMEITLDDEDDIGARIP